MTTTTTTTSPEDSAAAAAAARPPSSPAPPTTAAAEAAPTTASAAAASFPACAPATPAAHTAVTSTDVVYTLSNGIRIAAKTWGAVPEPPASDSNNSDKSGSSGGSDYRRRPVYVAVHGWLDNANTWDLVAPALVAELDAYVVCVDLAGHGRSDPLPPMASYSPWDHASTLLDLLDTHLPALTTPTVRLLGHSMGGHVCFLFAGAFPARVEELVVCESLGYVNRIADDAQAMAAFLRKRREYDAAIAAASAAASAGSRDAVPVPPKPKVEVVDGGRRVAVNGKTAYRSVAEAARSRRHGVTRVSERAALRLCERGLERVSGGEVAAALRAVAATASSGDGDGVGDGVGEAVPEEEGEEEEEAAAAAVYTWTTDKRLMLRHFARWDHGAVVAMMRAVTARVLVVLGTESVLFGAARALVDACVGGGGGEGEGGLVHDAGDKSAQSAVEQTLVERLQALQRGRGPAAAGEFRVGWVEGGSHHAHLEEETAPEFVRQVLAFTRSSRVVVEA
ncbi:Alpha/Beta hydrolase protein [Zopfochytrium polystomum]|nr:Alpha/Beta hydrolase protein [Zopfochytrium polystomum]